MTTRVVQVDLAEPVVDVAGLNGYDLARVLLRYRERVVGQAVVPVVGGLLGASDVTIAVYKDEAVRARLSELIVEERLTGKGSVSLPSWTVVVCTRDRPEQVRRCIESLLASNDKSGEIIVVDNAPSNEATARIVARYPVRYLREETPGLNRARTLGAREASGEIVIYTDDDTIADPGWVQALLSEFSSGRVGAVTGLTMPYELETEAQEVFELYGGFSKGFRRTVFDLASFSPAGAGAVGSGASMAFRRDVILSEGLFETELDLGTAARTGGDTYALYRVMSEGYRVVYTPDALNWHEHRRDRRELRRTMSGYGTGLYAFLTKCLLEDKDLPSLRIGISWFRRHHLRELARTLARRPGRLPIDIIGAEIKGSLVAPFAYLRSRRAERRRRPAENVTVVGRGAA